MEDVQNQVQDEQVVSHEQEQEQNDQNEQQEEQTFLSDTIEFEEETHYNLDDLNLNPEHIEEFTPVFDRLHQNGVTQEHMELFFDIVKGYDSPQAVQERLSQNLPMEIKRAYKPLKNYAEQSLGLTGQELDDAMTDELVLKVMYASFKGTKSPKQTLMTPQRSTPHGNKLTDDQVSEKAKHFFRRAGKTHADQKSFVEDLISQAQNPETIRKRYKTILNKK